MYKILAQILIILLASLDIFLTFLITKSLIRQAGLKKTFTRTEISDSKLLQGQFLPLKTNEATGELCTTMEKTMEGARVFSYYKGADELSGDYFDCVELDKNHLAFIKCDVSGHGVSAAMIMIQVSTMFREFLMELKEEGGNEEEALEGAVKKINDLIENRGFNDRFAAFVTGILDTSSGKVTLCNAGDSIINIYDGEKREMKHVKLPNIPAAGIFRSDFISPTVNYEATTLTLKKGDILYLFTDGIEESRHFLNKKGSSSSVEYFGSQRMDEILTAANRREEYLLQKEIPRSRKQEFHLDFKNLEESPEGAVMAVIACEKLFRLKKAFPLSLKKTVMDKSTDDFLTLHCSEYLKMKKPSRNAQDKGIYIQCLGLNEEEQTDDLTIMAIKKE